MLCERKIDQYFFQGRGREIRPDDLPNVEKENETLEIILIPDPNNTKWLTDNSAQEIISKYQRDIEVYIGGLQIPVTLLKVPLPPNLSLAVEQLQLTTKAAQLELIVATLLRDDKVTQDD